HSRIRARQATDHSHVIPVLPSLPACLRRAAAVILAFVFIAGPSAADSPAPVKTMLQSEQPSGNPTVDRIPVEFHPASAPAGERSPAVVLLHPLGTKKLTEMRVFARYLAGRGIGAAIMTLPYHMQRLPSGEKPGRRF